MHMVRYIFQIVKFLQIDFLRVIMEMDIYYMTIFIELIALYILRIIIYVNGKYNNIQQCNNR